MFLFTGISQIVYEAHKAVGSFQNESDPRFQDVHINSLHVLVVKDDLENLLNPILIKVIFAISMELYRLLLFDFTFFDIIGF